MIYETNLELHIGRKGVILLLNRSVNHHFCIVQHLIGINLDTEFRKLLGFFIDKGVAELGEVGRIDRWFYLGNVLSGKVLEIVAYNPTSNHALIAKVVKTL